MTATVRPGFKGDEELTQILWWLVFLRVVVSVFILGATFLLDEPFHVPVFSIVLVNVLVTLALALLIPTFGERKFFIYLLVYWDFIFVAMLMALTGVSRSIFSFLFLLAVINAGILLSRREAFLAASLALLLYTSVLSIEVYDVKPVSFWLYIETGELPILWGEMLYKILLHGLAFFVAAFLSSYVSEQSRTRQSRLVKAQRDIESLRTLYENIVASVPIGILTLDNENRASFANRIASRLVGIPSEQIIGNAIEELLPAHSNTDSTGDQRQFILDRPGEDPLHLKVFEADLRNPGGTRIGRIVLVEDQSELRKMEEEIKLSDKFAAVGKMAAGIAHEIRNPLASISGSIQLLKGELKLDDLNSNLMDIVVREADRLNKLITEFLAFARPTKTEEEIVDLNMLMNETIDLCQNDPAYSDSIKFVRNFAKGAYLRADASQLRQLFWNLFVNSIQAMPKGGQIEVVTAMTGKSSDVDPLPKQVQVKISDNGIGISKDVLPQVFDPFFTTKESGTGLGLTTAYRIVENHNGKITLESQPGLGTSFYIILPLG